jgi:hypothetical protein
MRRWIILAAALSLPACESGGRPGGEGGTGNTTSGGTASTGGIGGGADMAGLHVTPGQTTSGGGNSGGTTGSDKCGVQNFMLIHGTIPELLIVQDRSGSMMEDPDGSGGLGNTPSATSKWVQMRTAIEQVVAATTTIQWGLEMFPQVGMDNKQDGCAVGTTLDVAIAANSGGSIKTALDAAKPGGLTPTGAAINTAAASFMTGVDSDMHPKYILLATDGEPTCSTDAQMLDDPNTDAENAVTAAVNLGYHVFVAGIGTDTGDVTELTKLANLGMEPNTTAGQPPYYQVSSSNDLVTVLTKIAGQIVSCNYALQMPPTNPDLVEIQSDGQTVPHDTTHTNGWDYGPMDMSIVFYGSACADLQSGVVQSVAAVYDCPPIS